MHRFWAHTARFVSLSKPQVSGLAWAWALLLFVSNAYAGQVTLAWDAVSAPGLSGYRLYYGQFWFLFLATRCRHQTTYTVPGLTDGQTYYFAVTAYDADEESAFSNEVSVTIGAPPLRVVSVDSQELVGENGAATNAIDGNPATFWHTEWSQRTAPLPHTLVLDLGAAYQVDGSLSPTAGWRPNGTERLSVLRQPRWHHLGHRGSGGHAGRRHDREDPALRQNGPLCAPGGRLGD